MSISDYDNPRLVSIGAPNSNDAAFVLVGAMGLVVYQLFNKLKFFNIVLSILAFAGIIFTWSRSAWAFVLIYFTIFVSLNKKMNSKAILFVFFLLFQSQFWQFNFLKKEQKMMTGYKQIILQVFVKDK